MSLERASNSTSLSSACRMDVRWSAGTAKALDSFNQSLSFLEGLCLGLSRPTREPFRSHTMGKLTGNQLLPIVQKPP